MTKAKQRVIWALNKALDTVKEARGIVLLVVYDQLGEPEDKHVEVASNFRDRHLTDEELKDLLLTAANFSEPSRI